MKKMKFKKIPIETILQILSEMYNEGANFIDIEGIKDVNVDDIIISAQEDYYAPLPPQKLTDNDLNQLI